MIEQSVSLASNGVVKVPGYEQLVRFGYTKNRGVYRLHVDATGEWEGLTIRCFWHLPGRRGTGVHAGEGRLCGRARQRDRPARLRLRDL